MSNEYELIEQLAKALHEKDEALNDAESDLIDREYEAIELNDKIDLLKEKLAKVKAEYVEKFQRDGDQIQQLNELVNGLKKEGNDELEELRAVNESLRQGLVASQANVMRLNKEIEKINQAAYEADIVRSKFWR